MTTAAAPGYPVRVTARLDSPLSRWLWLVKWAAAIPHYVVLAFLWVAFVLLSVGAFFAIVFTGRYPRSIFDFNVGVLRWTWRVQYYTYGALATDQYPPFTLDDVPDYPAHFDVSYPDHLSRGLVLVKWWLLALPHYIVVGLFLGGSVVLGWHIAGGLIGLLAVVAAVVLLFTGRYPEPIFDFVLGMNRWVLRVAAYAGLMTDEYPPFRLDMGGDDTGSTAVLPGAPPPPTAGDGPTSRPWTAGRVVAVVAGSVLLLGSMGLFAGGGVALWADQHRDGGYITSGFDTYRTGGYAISTERVSLGDPGLTAGWQADIFGKLRVRVASLDQQTPVFVGIGRSDAVDRYLSGVQRSELRDLGRHHGTTAFPGTAPAGRPAAQRVWAVSSLGIGEQTLVWPVRGGDWTVVAMNADASRGLGVNADVGATVPVLPWIAAGLLIAAGVFLVAGIVLVVAPVRGAVRPSDAAGPAVR